MLGNCCGQVAQSAIGRNCHIGKDAVVVGSYLLEGVRIHNGAQVRFARTGC